MDDLLNMRHTLLLFLVLDYLLLHALVGIRLSRRLGRSIDNFVLLATGDLRAQPILLRLLRFLHRVELLVNLLSEIVNDFIAVQMASHRLQ